MSTGVKITVATVLAGVLFGPLALIGLVMTVLQGQSPACPLIPVSGPMSGPSVALTLTGLLVT